MLFRSLKNKPNKPADHRAKGGGWQNAKIIIFARHGKGEGKTSGGQHAKDTAKKNRPFRAANRIAAIQHNDNTPPIAAVMASQPSQP